MDNFERNWKNAFGETLEQGVLRVKQLTRNFAGMKDFEMIGKGDYFDGTRTTMRDRDFARIAILANVGIASLVKPQFLTRDERGECVDGAVTADEKLGETQDEYASCTRCRGQFDQAEQGSGARLCDRCAVL